MLKAEVLTPDRKVFQGSVISINVPGSKGRFEVLKDHAPLISSLGKGKVTIKKADETELAFDISGGFIEVLKNEVAVLVENVYEID